MSPIFNSQRSNHLHSCILRFMVCRLRVFASILETFIGYFTHFVLTQEVGKTKTSSATSEVSVPSNQLVIGGFFQASGWPAVVAMVANWYGKGRRGLIMGTWSLHTSLGNILGAIIAGAFINYIWAWSFIVPGIIIAGMGIVTFLFLIEYPTDIGCEPPTIHTQEEMFLLRCESSMSKDISAKYVKSYDGDVPDSMLSIPDSEALPTSNEPILSEQPAITFWRALMIPGVVEFAMALFFCKLVSYTFLFWLPFYINSTTDLSDQKSAYLSTLFDVGGSIGGIAIGLLSDVTGSSAIVSFVTLIICAPVIYIYNLFSNATLVQRTLLMMLTAFFTNAPYTLMTTAVCADLGTHPTLRGNSKALATVSSIIDGTGTIGAAIGPLLTGIINSNKALSDENWMVVFLMLAGSEILSALCLTRLVYKDLRSCCRRRNQYRVLLPESTNASKATGSE